MKISILKNLKPFGFLAVLTLLLAPTTQLVGQDDAPERPATEKLLPETTQMFVQIGNIREFIEKAGDTGVGQVFENEDIGNLVDSVYGEATDAYDRVKEDIGLELEDFQNLPQGELSFAIVAPARADLQYVFFMEIDDESDSFKNIMERGREVAEEQGEGAIVEETEDITYETFTVDEVQFITFQKDGLFVGASSRELANQIVDRWNDVEIPGIRPLTENRKFVTVMNRCRGTKDVPPDLRMFIDPIGLARGATRGDIGAQTVINFLPILGLDGLSAIGASAIMDELGFESVGHMHVMLANPRAGLIKMMALKPGEYTPEEWVPESVGAYFSTSWDVNVFIAELEKIVDTFGGEGTFKKQVDSTYETELDLDFREDMVPAFSGRISYMTWLNFPVDFSAQVQVVAFHIGDQEKFDTLKEKTLMKLEEDGELETIDEVDYRGSTYWTESGDSREDRNERQMERRRKWAERNGNDPDEITLVGENYKVCVGIIDEMLIICTSPDFFEEAVDTFLGEEPALVDNDEFVETTDTVAKLLRNDTPGAIFYQQPAKSVEFMYGLLQSDNKFMGDLGRNAFSRQRNLDEEEQSNSYRMFSGVKRSFEENPLPEFDEIRGLFAPSGGFITNDESGYHMMMFQLKHDR